MYTYVTIHKHGKEVWNLWNWLCICGPVNEGTVRHPEHVAEDSPVNVKHFIFIWFRPVHLTWYMSRLCNNSKPVSKSNFRDKVIKNLQKRMLTLQPYTLKYIRAEKAVWKSWIIRCILFILGWFCIIAYITIGVFLTARNFCGHVINASTYVCCLHSNLLITHRHGFCVGKSLYSSHYLFSCASLGTRLNVDIL